MLNNIIKIKEIKKANQYLFLNKVFHNTKILLRNIYVIQKSRILTCNNLEFKIIAKAIDRTIPNFEFLLKDIEKKLNTIMPKTFLSLPSE
nr:hypothetical protein DBT53_10700 [Aerococcus mictus]